MIPCVSVKNMRLSDQQTIQRGGSGRELIMRAAHGVFRSVEWKGNVAIVTGSGNNGADGYALASILHLNGTAVTVFKVSESLHDDCAYFASEAECNGVPIKSYRSGEENLLGFNIIVDCMLGTGFKGALRENYRNAIQEINDTNAFVVSVDINSGMNGDTGEGSVIIFSDLTVVIQFVKKGMISSSAGNYIKQMICVDIGIELATDENMICSAQEWELFCKSHSVSSEKSFFAYNDTIYFKSPPWLSNNR